MANDEESGQASWFPVYENQLEDRWFSRYTNAEKVVYFAMQSDYNGRGLSYYRADIEYAAMLNLSLHKVRESRRKFDYDVHVSYVEGRQINGRNLATKYNFVKWSTVLKDHGQFSQLHRFSFEYVLHLLRLGELSHREVVAYVCVMHLWWCKCEFRGTGRLEIAKRLLDAKTNIPRCAEALATLREAVLRATGQAIFELQDRHTAVTITGVTRFPDPRVCLQSDRLAAEFERDMRQRAAMLRNPSFFAIDPRIAAL